MFGIGFSELVIIIIALFIFVGPKRLSQVTYNMGKWLQKIKSSWREIKEKELSEFDTSSFYEANVELNKSLDELNKPHKK